jgi:hypothetical protein
LNQAAQGKYTQDALLVWDALSTMGLSIFRYNFFLFCRKGLKLDIGIVELGISPYV